MVSIAKKTATLLVSLMLVIPVFFMAGCGEEKAEFSVFWAKDQSESPESTYTTTQLNDAFLSDNSDNEKPFKTLTVGMQPGSERTLSFKIWNRIKYL